MIMIKIMIVHGIMIINTVTTIVSKQSQQRPSTLHYILHHIPVKTLHNCPTEMTQINDHSLVMAIFNSYVNVYQNVYPLISQYFPILTRMKPYEATLNTITSH